MLIHGDIGLCVRLAVIVTDEYKQVLARRGTGAQALLNLLQAVCSLVTYPGAPPMQALNDSVWISRLIRHTNLATSKH
jgi:hypothetical protein